MKNRNYLLLVSIGLNINSFGVKANSLVPQLKQSLSQAISDFENASLNNWSYKVSRYENEEGDISSRVEVFNPSKPVGERWHLLRMNDEKPSETQLKKYSKAKRKTAEEKSDAGISIKLRELIQLDSVRLLSQDKSSLSASFKVNLSRLSQDANSKLAGTLIYNKEQQFIEAIQIENTAMLSPMFSAKITEFTLSFSFIKFGDDVLPQEQQLYMKGRFAFFTEINEVSTDTFTHYKYVGD